MPDLKIHLQPRARENRIVGWHADALKIRLTAPPVDQKANRALLRFLAETFAVPRGGVTLLRGEKGREKEIRIQGISEERIREILGRLLPSP